MVNTVDLPACFGMHNVNISITIEAVTNSDKAVTALAFRMVLKSSLEKLRITHYF